MSETESVMRTSLVPGLLRNAVRNLSRQVQDVRLFEIGRTFRPRTAADATTAPRDQKLPVEEDRLAILLHGPASPFGWGMPTRHVDFFDIKRVAEGLFDTWRLDVEYEPGDLPKHLHPNAAAKLILGGKPIGWIGQIHPQSLLTFDLNGAFFIVDLDARIFSNAASIVRYKPLPRFPGIRRDLACLAADTIAAGQLVSFVRAEARQAAPFLEEVELFDVYQGKPIPAGRLSLALAFFFRHAERTLTDQEIQSQFDALVQRVKDRFGVEVREG
jgi:phenylalanyl-tRNA synthetase beta chain